MIHKSAIIHPKSKLGKGVSVGPHTIIGEGARIGDGTIIGPNCVIEGSAVIGQMCELFTGVIIGTPAQDRKYKGGSAFVNIGDRNVIREYVTINLSNDAKDKTLVGNDNFIMAYSHIAHNCKVGNNTTLANATTLGGHVVVEDGVTAGGLTAVHQFVRIGKLAITGGASKVAQDIVPFSMVDGHPAKVYGINSIGLDRSGISADTKSKIKKAFKILFSMKLNIKNAIKKIKQEFPACEEVSYLIKFINSSKRGIAR